MAKKVIKVARPKAKSVMVYNVAKLPQRIRIAMVVYGD